MSRYREPYTIYKRGDYWYYRTYDNNGVRTSGKTTGKKQKNEARAYCEELYKSGKLFVSSKKFNLFGAGFFDPDSFYFKDRVKPPAKTTIAAYNNALNNYIMPFFQNYELGDINYIALKKFRMSLLNRGIAINTIKSIMGTLTIMLNVAYRAGDIVTNPIDKLEPLQNIDDSKKDAFTLEEIKLIYKNISPEFKSFVLIMSLTGLRISEVAGVTPDSFKSCSYGEYIDLKKQFLRGELVALKTRNSIRPVPVIPEIKKLFNDIEKNESQKTEFYIAFKNALNIITDSDERHLTPHSLRHFFITNTKSKGLIESKVEFVAGHSLRGVRGTYTNYKCEDLAEFITWQNETYKLITE